ncbi:MAG: hypothetical protein ACLQDM_29145 [Bradyrhizobium sp.]
MKKRLQQWSGVLSTAFPTASSPYWRSQPIGSMKSLLAGIFFSASVVGFAFDLLQLPLPPLGRGFFWPLVLGAAAVGTLVTRIKRIPILLFLIVVLIWLVGGLSGLGWLGVGWLTYPISLFVVPSPIPQTMRLRILFDAIGIWVGATLAPGKLPRRSPRLRRPRICHFCHEFCQFCPLSMPSVEFKLAGKHQAKQAKRIVAVILTNRRS